MMLHQNLRQIKFMNWRRKNFGLPRGRGGRGVWGEFRRARAFRRSAAKAVSSVQKMFEQSYIILQALASGPACCSDPPAGGERRRARLPAPDGAVNGGQGAEGRRFKSCQAY